MSRRPVVSSCVHRFRFTFDLSSILLAICLSFVGTLLFHVAFGGYQRSANRPLKARELSALLISSPPQTLKGLLDVWDCWEHLRAIENSKQSFHFHSLIKAAARVYLCKKLGAFLPSLLLIALSCFLKNVVKFCLYLSTNFCRLLQIDYCKTKQHI